MTLKRVSIERKDKSKPWRFALKADRDAVVLEAEAYRESEQLRGDGDAKAAEQYASAYNKDPEFYEFYRSINAYSEVFANKSDLLVLDPNSEFFKYLQDGNVKK